MVTFESKITHESKSMPGVTFTVRRLNQIQRAKRDLALASTRIDQLARDWRAGTKGMKAGDTVTDPALLQLAADISLEDTVHSLPVVLRHGLVSIEGLSIDGAPATVEMLISDGPEDLITEIKEACQAAAGLSVEQTKNSQSPGDSSRQTDGTPNSTTADTAAA